ncbi:hypothetical protein [Cellulosimicrobium cellulans]|uniref:hypothetical protein n=1 Tax=Cellulosimicrobium cellulans TaxID=1710 RepID=UPI001F05E1E2|nr:hypothetical protein [Cellulosimicrobium cellulans]
MLAHYADRLGERGGRLYVSGVDPELAAKFEQVIDLRLRERIAVYPARPVIGESTADAMAHAEAWLVRGVEAAQVPAVRRDGPAKRLWSRVRSMLHRG